MTETIEANLSRAHDQSHSADLGAFDALLSCFGQLPRIIGSGRLTPRDRIEQVDGWFFGFFSYLASGPPGHRLEELLALSRAGVLRFLGADLTVEGDEVTGRFVARTSSSPEVTTASVFVEARLPAPHLARTHDRLLQALVRARRGRRGRPGRSHGRGGVPDRTARRRGTRPEGPDRLRRGSPTALRRGCPDQPTAGRHVLPTSHQRGRVPPDGCPRSEPAPSRGSRDLPRPAVTLTTADLIDIRQLLATYGLVVDDHLWDRVDEVFAEDFVFDRSAFGIPDLHGAADVIATFKGRNLYAHHTTDVVITEDGRRHGVGPQQVDRLPQRGPAPVRGLPRRRGAHRCRLAPPAPLRGGAGTEVLRLSPTGAGWGRRVGPPRRPAARAAW